jgi:tetratricopeptide (TPR) repeat protein
MSKFKPLLFASLGFSVAAGAPLVAHGQATQPLPPAVAAKLRHLLPFPEASLDPKMEMTIGLDYSPEYGSRLFRQSTDYAAQVVAVRRTLTGGFADAARYRALGGLYRRAGLPVKSKAAFGRSEAIERAALRRRPDDGTALAGYGRTLEASGQAPAAEAFLQKATRSAPESADVWLALGAVLDHEASPRTEAKTHRERGAEEAYDKAVALAPQDPATWATRGGFRTWSLPAFHGKLYSRDGLSDYGHAAALSPNDPYAQATVPTIDCFTFEVAHNIFTSLKAARMEPADADRRAESYLRRITAIARSTSGPQSAAAYAARAWVQFEFFYDFKGAQESLRLALRQDPREQDASDYQIHVAAVSGDYPLVAAACRREIRRHPAVRLRVTLADADYTLGRKNPVYWEEGRTQMERAHAAEPGDYAISLGLAALLLESPQTAHHRVVSLLNRIAPQASQRPREQRAEYDVTRGIASALAGHQEGARISFRSALRSDPKNQVAKSALALLPE